MEGAVRVFAGEFSQADFSVTDGDDRSGAWVVTPTGAYCRQVFLAGAFTELHDDGDRVHARLAEPTGGFDLSCQNRNSPAAAALLSLPRPSFISVSGQAQIYRQGSASALSVRPEFIRAIDREARNLWVLATADATLKRMERMRDVLLGSLSDERVAAAVRHYQMTPAKLDGMAAIIEGAVAGIRPTDSALSVQPDVRQFVIDILKAQPGPRGVAVQEIIDTLGAQGIFQDPVLKTIEALIGEDECYQPQKGYIRLL